MHDDCCLSASSGGHKLDTHGRRPKELTPAILPSIPHSPPWLSLTPLGSAANSPMSKQSGQKLDRSKHKGGSWPQ